MLYNIYQIDDSHYEAIQQLYRKCFKLWRSKKYIARKYRNCIGFIAYINEVPIAFYGILQKDIKVGSSIYNAAHSAPPMTDPQHQKRGLFTFLANKTYQEAISKGIDFILSFPNLQSFQGFKKMEWSIIGYIKKLELKINTLPIAEICYYFNIPYRFTFSNSVGNFSINNHLLVSNLNEKNTEKEIINAIKKYAFWTGCHKAIIICSDNSKDYRLLKNQLWIDNTPIGYYPLIKDIKFNPIITYNMLNTWT